MPRQSAKNLLSHVEHVHLVSGEAGKWLLAGIRANAQYLLEAKYLTGLRLVRRELYSASP